MTPDLFTPTLSLSDVLEYCGYLLACFGSGYVLGLKILALKKFADAI